MPQKRPPVPPAPEGLGESGRALWRAVLEGFELDEHERSLLLQAARTADLLDALQALLDAEGLMSETSQGPRVHPAAAELRQQRIVLARLLTSLRIPAGDEDARAPARAGTRGVYPLRGVS